MPLTKGAPLLCDFSDAQFDDPQNVDLVMPDVYRAPEVVLGMLWSYPIYVWGFAMTVCVTLHKASDLGTDLLLLTAMGHLPAEKTLFSTQRRWSLL